MLGSFNGYPEVHFLIFWPLPNTLLMCFWCLAQSDVEGAWSFLFVGGSKRIDSALKPDPQLEGMMGKKMTKGYLILFLVV